MDHSHFYPPTHWHPPAAMNSDLSLVLEILDKSCNLLHTFKFTSNEMKWKSFKEIIVWAKHNFFKQYNKYQQFGSTNYSNLIFPHFQLIHCNDVSIEDLSQIVPNEKCRILIKAKGIPKKIKKSSQSTSFNAKFDGLTMKHDIIRKKKIIQQKNRNNKLNKLKKKFCKEYSITKFESEKLKRIQNLIAK